ncbi:MAG: Uma2 family endonuclease [bacterium]|nr:MAG: Uma2 family endonuclease [bacterium]
MSEILTSPQPSTKRDLLTYDDYVTFPDSDGIRKEIIEGELFMTPAPATKHQLILLRLAKMLDDYIHQNDLGTVLISPYDVIFSNINIMQPDILFISNENLSILTDLNAKGTPDLVVEILSPSTVENDCIYKKLVYEKYVEKEYWIVDPQEEMIEFWQLKDASFQLFHKARKTEKFKSKLLEELDLDLLLIF